MATGNFNVSNARSPILQPNRIFSNIFNMIINQEIFSDNIKGTYGDLASRFKANVGLFGDTVTYYATDCGEVEDWVQDSSSELNVLDIKRPASPKVQYIEIDTFKKVWTTIGNYLSKQAFLDQGTHAQFNSIVLGWLSATRRIYESKMVNVFVGNHISNAQVNTVTVNLKDAASTDPLYGITGEEKARMEAGIIGQELADLTVNLKDATRKYNDYGMMRSYNDNDFIYVTNSRWINKIEKRDLPTTFHKDGIIGKLGENVLPSYYFGRPTTASDVTASTGVVDSTNFDPVYSKVARGLTINGTYYYVFPGDVIPDGATVIANGDFELAETYVEDPNVICKVIHKNAVKFLTAFSSNTAFWNARNLTTNHYLIFGFAEPAALYNYPFITVKASV